MSGGFLFLSSLANLRSEFPQKKLRFVSAQGVSEGYASFRSSVTLRFADYIIERIWDIFTYVENENQRAICPTKELRTRCILLTYTVWSHLGLNQGLPDYESGALTD